MLFDEKTLMQLTETLDWTLYNAQKVPVKIVICVFSFLIIGVTLFLEGHLLFKLFENLSGDNQKYWSPEYMAISAGVIAIGFHILAREHPDSFAFRFVKKCTQFLIPIYLFGVGLIISGMIVGDGIGAILEGETLSWESANTEPQENILERLFAQISHPVATLAFSIGIGGFAIINIFVVHNFLQRIELESSIAMLAMTTYFAIKKDYALAMKCHEAYTENEFDIADHELQADEQYIADQQGAIALTAINTALAPHEELLKESQLKLNHQPDLIDTHTEIDTKQLEKFIAKIRALDLAGIKKIMLSK